MRIIKKKIGNQIYFYLRHTFRKNKKYVTKDKYLGKKIPENIEGIKDQIEKNIKSELNNKLLLIKKNFQKEWKKIPESVKEEQLKEIAIAFTYNTNAIEGSTITLEETREILQDRISPRKSIRDIRETEAHAKTFLLMLNGKIRIDESLILDWHKKIFSETKEDISGRYRNYLVRVGEYLTPDWQDVPDLMRELFNYINSKDVKNINPVEFAARIHYKFEKIHPFGDGNGRIGRLLMNYSLWKEGYPMLIIEYKNRKSYYKALKKSEDLFVRYFIRRYIKVHEKRAIIA